MLNPVASATPYDDDDEINLTPMLDVVFIMLIFFIVTASFIKEYGIEVSRPESSREIVAASETILILIDDASRIWIDGRIIDPRAVRANIERARSQMRDGRVVIDADSESLNDTLVQVIDASRAAGIYDVALIDD